MIEVAGSEQAKWYIHANFHERKASTGEQTIKSGNYRYSLS